MFFIISKILSFLTDPFFWIILLILLALFAKKKYRRRKYLWCGTIIFFIFSNTYIYKAVFSFWKINERTLLENYDYGILLGGVINLNSTEDNIQFTSSSERILYTVNLYQSKKIKKIIISGASGSMIHNLIEADIIKKYLTDIGIPKKDIITENKSKNTFENAQFTTRLIKKLSKYNQPKCLLITSNYHIRRSLACFKKAGLKVDPYVIDLEEKYFNIESLIIPQPHILWEWKKLTHEFFGFMAYRIAGYI